MEAYYNREDVPTPMIERTNAVFRDTNSKDVIKHILEVDFPEIESIADLTWGKGAFWKDASPRSVVGLDYYPRLGAQIGADARHVPLVDGAVDLAIFDPPHQHGVSKTTTLGHQADYGRLPSQKDVHQLLADTLTEIRRIASEGAIIKLTDMVEAGRYMPTHMMFAAAAANLIGWPCDLAILDSGVVRPVRPNQRVLHLRHAHSYFLVYKWNEREPRSPFWRVGDDE